MTLNVGSVSHLTNAQGDAFSRVPVPYDSALNGGQLCCQWVCVDPAAPGGATVSNGARLTICH